ncbi:preprotein translocase subunit SecG [Phenylobacterium sp.]|jgi:preprotein translocase subunit SecG|uniref:preprotein translocase subunit SecG n=1 Tax=Phenylobacterium sp. TaxID=1871053 RepID=UPI002F4285CB
MLIGLLLTAQIIVSIALVCVVLLQRSEGSGFVGGGGSAGVMSVRGVGDLLTRTTWILGSAFFIISLLLTILAGRERGASSVVDRLKIDNIDPSTLNRPKPSLPPAGTAQPGGPQSAPVPLQAPTPQINNPFLGQQPAQPPAK